MKRLAVILVMMVSAAAALAQTSATAEPNLSPAEQSVAEARKLIGKNPKNFEAYNALALALSRRAHDTSDVSFYALAETALEKSFEMSPGNFEGERIHVWLLVGKHEYAQALAEAAKLNKKMPDDVMVYGALTDANVGLGNYKDAETACQRMLDLRTGNLPGVTRAAYLRELFGDIEGSLELMNMASQSTPPTQAEDSARILAQMAHLNLAIGNLDKSEQLLRQALVIYPGYYYALGNLAQVRIQQQRYGEAVELLKQRYQASPRAENLYDLAEALQLAGQRDDARKTFAEFEEKSLLESNRADNSNHELIFYYADHANNPLKAMEVAKREIARRHDVFTLDSYAWALYENGQYGQARKQIEAALAVGIRNAKMFRHAGEIALRVGDKQAAEVYLRQAAELNGAGSALARRTLVRSSLVAVQ